MSKIKLVLPKGRIFAQIQDLLEKCGYKIVISGRELKPYCSDPDIEVKIMKPQNIPYLLDIGSHDIGFTGWDWCVETNCFPLEIMDLGFNPVKIVSAIPKDWNFTEVSKKKIIVVSEYETIAEKYLRDKGLDYRLLRVHGATEVFPPDDADMIIDNTSTGSTIRENNLKIVDKVMCSSTRFMVNKEAMDDPWKRKKIEEMKLLFNAVILASKKVMLEMNIPEEKVDDIIPKLPAMKSPTISKLFGGAGFAVKIVINESEVSRLIPMLKAWGASDILEYKLNKVVT